MVERRGITIMHRLSLLPSGPYLPTASELHRAAECVAPWALGLPEAEEEPGEWAEMGRHLHEVAEEICAYKGERLPLLGANKIIGQHIAEAVKVDVLLLKQGADGVFYIEQGLQWRPGFPDDEARLVTRAPGERERGWFSGTADLAYVRADGVLVVIDWKFGERTRWIGERAKDHAQLWTLALALATALGIRGSSENVIVARVEARHVNADGIEVDGHDLTQGMIDAWADTLRTLARRIDTATDASPKLSAACGRCRAKEACPAWNALEQAILGEICDQGAEAFLRPPTSPHEVRLLYHATEAAESAVENWEQWVQAWCLVHPEGVEIGLGLKLQSREKASRAVVQTSEAMALIEEVAGTGAIEVKRKSSIGVIEKAVKEAAGAGITSRSDRDKARRAAVESAIARLVEGGAIQEKGAKWGVVVRRSDGTETVWKGNEEE
jgi:hypothetical protein